MSLYKEQKWAKREKKYRNAHFSDEGTNAACVALGNKVQAIAGPKPDGETRSILVPFFSVDGFHGALAKAAQYLQAEMNGRKPLGRYFWCHVTEDADNKTWLVEAGAY